MDPRATDQLNPTGILEPCILWQCFCRVNLQGPAGEGTTDWHKRGRKEKGEGFIGGLMGLCMVYQMAKVLLTCFCCNLSPTSCHEFNVSQMKCARKEFEDVSDFFSAEVHHLHGSLCKTKHLMLAVWTAKYNATTGARCSVCKM